MNIDELREEIANDEGKVMSVYLDHLNLPTLGIGHLITEWDEEHGKPVGTEVSEERVNELFAKDIEVTITECKELAREAFLYSHKIETMNFLIEWGDSNEEIIINRDLKRTLPSMVTIHGRF